MTLRDATFDNSGKQTSEAEFYVPLDWTGFLQDATTKLGNTLFNRSMGRKVTKQDGQTMYDDESGAVDNYVFSNPQCTFFQSAGNKGEVLEGNPAICGIAVSKNVITVGATLSRRPKDGFQAAITTKNNAEDPACVASWSSSGPPCLTASRIKPDVMAPGSLILSVRAQNLTDQDIGRYEAQSGRWPDVNWTLVSGTSQATPLVSGCAAILRVSSQAIWVQEPQRSVDKSGIGWWSN